MRDPLELSGREFQALVDQAMKDLVHHVDSLPDQSAGYSADGAALARSLREGPPENGVAFEELLRLLFDDVIPVSYNTAGPGYLAYIPGGGVLATAVADLIANAVNRYVGVWVAAPGLAQLEVNVVQWFCDIVGLPEGAGGILTTGGSLANLMAMVAARRDRLPTDFLSGTLYTSDQSHYSVRKAAVLAGFPPEHVREIHTDRYQQIDLDHLRSVLREDREAGLQPFLVSGNAGTTNTGAVDDLTALGECARDEGLWYHVDAAYGGFFCLTDRGRVTLRGLEMADSIVMDPHKGLFLPYGNGSLLVRDPNVLRRANADHADYMPPMQDDPALVDFCQLTPELSRDVRGLRAWLPLKLHGLSAFRAALNEKLDLAAWACDQLRQVPGVLVTSEPQLSIVTFRVDWPGRPVEEVNRATRELMARVNARRRVYLTGTRLGEYFVIRICVLSFRTHQDRMEMCLEDIREVAGALAAA